MEVLTISYIEGPGMPTGSGRLGSGVAPLVVYQFSSASDWSCVMYPTVRRNDSCPRKLPSVLALGSVGGVVAAAYARCAASRSATGSAAGGAGVLMFAPLREFMRELLRFAVFSGWYFLGGIA